MCEKSRKRAYRLHIEYVGFLHEFRLLCQLKTYTKYGTPRFRTPLYVAQNSISPVMVLGYRISDCRLAVGGEKICFNIKTRWAYLQFLNCNLKCENSEYRAGSLDPGCCLTTANFSSTIKPHSLPAQEKNHGQLSYFRY